MPRPRIGNDLPPVRMDVYKCSFGYPTERMQHKASSLECLCEISCEPHIEQKDGTILCLHDGVTDHGHCPNDGEAQAEIQFLKPIKPQEIP